MNMIAKSLILNAFFRVLMPVLLLLPNPPASASSLDPEVEACVRKNVPKTTAIQKIELRSTDRVGAEKILIADV